MSRSAASTVWTVVGVVAAILLGLAVLFGPRLYREGRQLVGPITDLARADDELAALDRDLPFAPPPDGVVDETRLQLFLQVRRELIPHYQRWEAIRRELERSGDSQSWQTTKEVLAAVRDILTVQTSLLRQHRMSGAEFRWLEQQVYDNWYKRLGEGEPERRLRQATEEDLRFVTDLASRYGRSRALADMEQRLTERLAALSPELATGAAGIPSRALLERYRKEIAELDLSSYSELHARLRQGPGKGFKVNVGREPGGRSVVIGGSEVEATPGR